MGGPLLTRYSMGRNPGYAPGCTYNTCARCNSGLAIACSVYGRLQPEGQFWACRVLLLADHSLDGNNCPMYGVRCPGPNSPELTVSDLHRKAAPSWARFHGKKSGNFVYACHVQKSEPMFWVLPLTYNGTR